MLLFLRLFVKDCLMKTDELVAQARIAQNSTVRAIGGATWTENFQDKDLLREIFNVREINHTFLARSFGLYKESLRQGKNLTTHNIEYEKKLKLSKVKSKTEALVNFDDNDDKREKEEKHIRSIKREVKNTEMDVGAHRDQKEKFILETKIRRMKKAMHKVVHRSNQEFY